MRRIVPPLSLSAIVALSGCGGQGGAAADRADHPAGPPPVVDIQAADFAYQAPDTIPGGWVTLRIHNEGQELHHGALYRLTEGKTIADVMALGPGEMPAWMVAVGGPSAPNPGGMLEATVNLAPGNYLLICEVPSPDGKLHFMKGMLRPLTVVAPAHPAEPPAADITVRLTDYAFTFSRELTAGRYTFRVESAPGQPHEVVIARLAAGKTAEDLLAWVEKMDGPPPAEGIVGGTTALGAGEVNIFQAELTPGDYAVICFVPDARDGKPHAAHGMMRTIRIS